MNELGIPEARAAHVITDPVTPFVALSNRAKDALDLWQKIGPVCPRSYGGKNPVDRPEVWATLGARLMTAWTMAASLYARVDDVHIEVVRRVARGESSVPGWTGPEGIEASLGRLLGTIREASVLASEVVDCSLPVGPYDHEDDLWTIQRAGWDMEGLVLLALHRFGLTVPEGEPAAA